MNNAENALLAKAHAMYAKRLKESDYDAMLACRTNSELFAYLKSTADFGGYIDALPSVRLSRARFENAVRQAHLDKIASLCRFEKLIGESLYRYFIMKNEIETIIYCARHLDTNEITDLFTLPEFYKREQSVFGSDLQRAASFDELCEMLDGTPYKKILAPIATSPAGINLAVLENALYNHLYLTVSKTVEKGFKGKQREEILDCFRFLSDMTMINSLIRLNDSYSINAGYKANMYVSLVTKFTDRQLSALIGASDSSEVFKILRSSPYKKYFPENDTLAPSRRIRLAEMQMSVKKLRYSQNPIVCMLCYGTIAENEIQNITHIIEGIKYRLSPDEISEIIVKGEC